MLFNILSRLVIAFLSRSKRLWISWLQSPSTVILEPKKIKSVTVSIVSPSVCHEVMGLDAVILVFWMLSFKPAFHCPGSYAILLFTVSDLASITSCIHNWLLLLLWPHPFILELFLHQSPVAYWAPTDLGSSSFSILSFCLTQWNSHAMWGHPRWTGHGGEVWQNVVHWRKEWQNTSEFLPWEPHEQYEKTKW